MDDAKTSIFKRNMPGPPAGIVRQIKIPTKLPQI
jgi:hypothetical protein